MLFVHIIVHSVHKKIPASIQIGKAPGPETNNIRYTCGAAANGAETQEIADEQLSQK